MAKSKDASETPIQMSFLEPMECLLVSKLPEGPDWVYEIKLDGYRAQALCDGTTTKLLSRNGNDLGLRFPAMVRSLAAAIANGSIIDGELVALDSQGKPSFSLIQNSATSGATLVFFAFDLLQHEGQDLTRRPLSERRELLRRSLRSSDSVQLSESFEIPPSRCLRLYGPMAWRVSSPSGSPAPMSKGNAPGHGRRCASNCLRSWSSAAIRRAPMASMRSWSASTETTNFISAPV